ncbi:MAG: glycolate oxidase subunit GlcF [Pseudomonadota bacterium]
MQTNLAQHIRDTADGQEADAILRSCVHCGFCTATCPTYQLLGDELDGPRGRIYLIKQVLEGKPATASTQTHLDRCLTCLSCETTCPSGVRYGRLLDIGRREVDRQVTRPIGQRLVRATLRELLPRANLFGAAYKSGRLFKALLPRALQAKLPDAAPGGAWPTNVHARKMLLLQGCVQPAMAPNINASAARVLDRFGVQLVSTPKAGCCGAVRHHLDDHGGALADVRRNIDAWWPYADPASESPVEAIVSTASGCGVMVKEYGHILRDDPAYAARAAHVAGLARDLCEVLQPFERALAGWVPPRERPKVAYHPPCTLQHGQQIKGTVESLLRSAGIEVSLCEDSHICCGSAGTYSVLQAELATALRDRKLAALAATEAPVIASANIGCLTHLQSGTATPVRHWIELLDDATAPGLT